jgi:hypothetical protein
MTDDAVAVVHPTTGELLDSLEAQPPAVLADALYAVRQQNSQARKAERLLEAELRRRVGNRDRTVFVFGDYEVTAKPEYRREWDGDELEDVLRGLLEAGSLQAGELTEVIRHETSVSGSEAQRLLGRLSGEARTAVENCFTWRQKGPARVTVAPSVSLIPPEEGPGDDH